MKKILLIIGILFTLALISTAQNHPTSQDSTLVSAGVNTAIHAGEIITGHAPLIPFLPDSATGSMATGLILFIWRLIEKRKLRKKGLLIDKPNPASDTKI